MSKLEQIAEDLKSAMRAKDEISLAVLRMLMASIKNKKIELKKQEELNDEEIIGVLSTEVKKRKDSIEAYQAGNRQDLVERETAEIRIIEKYLPAQMDEASVRAIIKEIISATGASSPAEFGKVMGAAMNKLKGRADGSLVQQLVKAELQ